MGFVELLILAIGLSMDSFAISICKGLSASKCGWKEGITAGLWFGMAQTLMIFLGWLVGGSFASLLSAISHWVAFGLLAFLGVKMLREAKGGDSQVDGSFAPKVMLPLVVATSIDATAIGLSFAFLGVDIVFTLAVICLVTVVTSAVGVAIGRLFGGKLQDKAGYLGGIALIAIGVKILIEGVLG